MRTRTLAIVLAVFGCLVSFPLVVARSSAGQAAQSNGLGNIIPTGQPNAPFVLGGKLCIVVDQRHARDTVQVFNTWTSADCQHYRDRSSPSGTYLLGCLGPHGITESAPNATSFSPCW